LDKIGNNYNLTSWARYTVYIHIYDSKCSSSSLYLYD